MKIKKEKRNKFYNAVVLNPEIDSSSFQEISITIEEAGHRALKMVVPFLLLSAVPFFIIHGLSVINQISIIGFFIFVVSICPGILAHELIHAMLFAIFIPGGFKSVHFGIDKKTLSPYCHPLVNMRVWAYRIGASAPLILLGIIPVILSFFNGNIAFMIFGFIFSIAAGGDIISLYMTRTLSSGDIIKDHSSKLGFYIISKKLQ